MLALLHFSPESAGVSLDYTSSCEYDSEAFAELAVLPHAPRVMYKNILDFATPNTRARLDELAIGGDRTRSQLKRLFLMPGSVSRVAWCHKSDAPVAFPDCWLHIAGHPCTDFSTMGSQDRDFIIQWSMVGIPLIQPNA